MIVGTWPVFPWAAGISAIGMVLAALYIMRLYRQTMTGEPNEVVQEKMTELTMLERIVIIPLLALLLVLGIYPVPLTNILNPDSEQAVTHVEQAVNASDNNTSVGVDAK